jgi:hypothetical protein
MVQHQLGDHLQTAVMRLLQEDLEVAQRAVGRVNVGVVGDVVAVVLERRGVERKQPDRGNSQILQVVQLRCQAAEVADAIVVAVGERADVQP